MEQDVVERIDKLANVDLVRLLDALEEADDALLEYEAGKRAPKATAAPPPTRARHGSTAKPAPQRAPRKVSPRRLRELWDGVRGPMVSHVEREQTLVLPGCRHICTGNDALRGGLKAPVRQMVAEHRQISEGVLAVRLEAALIEPVRREFLTVCRLWDEHVQEEEGLVFPEALSELTDEVSAYTGGVDRARDADDIGANLRLAALRRTAEPPLERQEEPKQGVVSRLFRGFWDKKN
ncbi:MAG: hemerythrin domain-containing protein [Deltaproteobacteria bacterium]|nr:MAG: hemerythrin domain-containing protein [Deltaproteobacteria bacterium]